MSANRGGHRRCLSFLSRSLRHVVERFAAQHGARPMGRSASGGRERLAGRREKSSDALRFRDHRQELHAALALRAAWARSTDASRAYGRLTEVPRTSSSPSVRVRAKHRGPRRQARSSPRRRCRGSSHRKSRKDHPVSSHAATFQGSPRASFGTPHVGSLEVSNCHGERSEADADTTLNRTSPHLLRRTSASRRVSYRSARTSDAAGHLACASSPVMSSSRLFAPTLRKIDLRWSWTV